MSNDTPIIGIDLGTTNSVVSYTDDAGVTHVIADETGARVIPSVIHFTSDDAGVIVGAVAKGNVQLEPDRVASVFKRGMGEPGHLPDGRAFDIDGKSYSPEELSSYVLKKLAGIAEQHFGRPATRAVITVPAYFGDNERAATKSAGEIAGLEVVKIINEPTAAAIAHGLDRESREEGLLLVFDLGGGTFDVTVMRQGERGEMDVIATTGDKQLGGADFDEAIVQRMAKHVEDERGINILEDPYQRANAYMDAEDIKKQLSTSASVTKPIVVGGPPVKFELTRSEFETMLSEQFEYIEDCTRLALDKTAEQLGTEDVEISTALMVGGSSRIPRCQALLKDIVGIEPISAKNLDEDVSRGAAMLGAKLGGDLDPRNELAAIPMPTDAASHALGITTMGDDGELYNHVVIPESTPVPHDVTELFSAVSDGQEVIEVKLNEGDDRNLTLVRELGSSVGRFARPVPRGYPIRIEVEYTADQLVVVNAFDGDTGAHMCELKVPRSGILSDAEKDDARKYLADVAVS